MITINSLNNWYALVVNAGREESIRKKILDKLERADTSSDDLTIICPDEEIVLEKKNGARERKRRMSLPGYILLCSRHMDDDLINKIVRVPGVISFLGGNEKPSPLPSKEVDKILGQQTTHKNQSVEPLFQTGDSVTITEGPLSGFSGTISDLNESAGTATVDVEIFGRETKTQSPLRQLRKA